MTTPGSGEGSEGALTAMLLQVTQHGERLAALEAAVRRQEMLIDALGGMDRQVAGLAARLAELAGGGDGEGASYRPVPAPRWWALAGEEREKALARVRAWVSQVYRPGYGHVAASLGACWEQHALCLYALDWLMELWSVLYLGDEREASVLAGQAEWQSRLLPAIAAQMQAETSRCQHLARTGP
jgi:hypothetical protein